MYTMWGKFVCAYSVLKNRKKKMVSGSTCRYVERGREVNVSGVLSQHPRPLGGNVSGAHLLCGLQTFEYETKE